MARPKVAKKWELTVAALLAEKTVEEAALKAGVPYRTVKAWLANPAFQELYRAARQGVLERTAARLLALTGKALDRLDRNLDCDETAPANRAVELVLVHSTKALELLDLSRRVEALEAQLKGKTS